MKKTLIVPLLFVLFVGILSGCTAPSKTAEKVTEATENSSQAVTEESHEEHSHSHSQVTTFEDQEVKDRSLADWSGEWQSIYPLLQAGKLDEVLQKKAAEKKDKTFVEYKEYYEVGYQTDVTKIDIHNEMVSFYQNETWQSGEYHYDGFKILTYESGNKGVRYLFSKVSGSNDAPQSIQFSDHIIAPEKSGHFHLYFGNQSHDELLKEMENWPTYYPSDLSTKEIVHEMMYH